MFPFRYCSHQKPFPIFLLEKFFFARDFYLQKERRKISLNNRIEQASKFVTKVVIIAFEILYGWISRVFKSRNSSNSTCLNLILIATVGCPQIFSPRTKIIKFLSVPLGEKFLSRRGTLSCWSQRRDRWTEFLRNNLDTNLTFIFEFKRYSACQINHHSSQIKILESSKECFFGLTWLGKAVLEEILTERNVYLIKSLLTFSC